MVVGEVEPSLHMELENIEQQYSTSQRIYGEFMFILRSPHVKKRSLLLQIHFESVFLG